MVSETKLNESFPGGQFKITGLSRSFRFDCNSNGDGIVLFVRKDVPVKLIFSEISHSKGFHVEINLSK